MWLPEDYVPVTVEKPYQRLQRSHAASLITGIHDDTYQITRLNTWIGGASVAGLDFPTDGNAYIYESLGDGYQLELTYWSRLLANAALTIALMLIALVLMRTTWENKILAVIVVGTVLCAVMQFQPEMVKQGIASAQYGIVALFLIWVTHGFFQCRHCCAAGSCNTEQSPEPVELKSEPVGQSEQAESRQIETIERNQSDNVLDIPEDDQQKDDPPKEE